MDSTTAIVPMFRRRRVTALIDAALAFGPVSLVIASPGYGKTRALQEAIAADPSCHWVELPQAAQVEDLVRSLTQTLIPDELASVPQFFTGAGRAKDLERLVEWFERRLEHVSDTVIIDDCHRCFGDPQAAVFLARMIDATTTHLRWILSGREMPALPIAKWIARGFMAPAITDAELAFDFDDALGLAKARGSAIDDEALRQIVDDSGGWPMAVQLALQLWDRTRSIVPAVVRTRETLFSRFETELWPHIDIAVRRVLIACALVPDLEAEVLESAGIVNASAMLEFAFETIPFVSRTTEGRYVLHELFAEFVRSQMQRQLHDVAELRDRLATALLSTGDAAAALAILVNGQADARVLDVLAVAGCELIEQGHRPTVVQALEFLATIGKRDEPIVVALRGILSYLDGDAANAEALYRDAYLRGLPSSMRVDVALRLCAAITNAGKAREAVPICEELLADGELAEEPRGEVLTCLACTLASAGEEARARKVMALIPSLNPEHASLRGVRRLQRLGYASYFLGDLRAAEAYARQAASLATHLKFWNVAALSHAIVCSVTALTERKSDVALEQARLTYVMAERAGDNGIMAHAVGSEYVIHAYRGDEAAFDRAELRLARFHDVRTYRASPTVRMARAFADAIRGNVAQAVEALKTADPHEMTRAENALRESMLLLLYALTGSMKERSHLRQTAIAESNEDFASRRCSNMARVLRGMALWCHGDIARAEWTLRVGSAGVAEIDRVLLESVAKLCTAPRHLLPEELVSTVLTELHTAGWGGFGRLIEMILAKEVRLSTAEIRTISAFQYGGSILNVARALGRSRNTLENQLKAIHRKIGCRNRREALVYMRSIGVIKDVAPVVHRETVSLTAAEIRTLCAFENGGSSAEVARALGRSILTVDTQLKRAYKKIGCANRDQALLYARAQGWLSASGPQAKRAANRRPNRGQRTLPTSEDVIVGVPTATPRVL